MQTKLHDSDIFCVRAALAEHIEVGFIWINSPVVESRTIVRISNQKGRAIYCEALAIDYGFVKKYNSSTDRKYKINKNDKFIIINKWYRTKLGIETNLDVNLTIEKSNFWTKRPWGALCASCTHPSNAIRLATYIALLSFLLGILGLFNGYSDNGKKKISETNELILHNQKEIIINLNNMESELKQVQKNFKNRNE